MTKLSHDALTVTLAAAAASPVSCKVMSFHEGLLTGWAYDPQTPHGSTRLIMLVDGQQITELMCNESRVDVAASEQIPEMVGFSVQLPARFLDGLAHRVEFRDQRRRHVVVVFNNSTGKAVVLAHKWRPTIHGNVDGLRGGGMEGWVLRSRRNEGGLFGDCVVRVSCQSVTLGFARANRSRPDVGKALESVSSCGFRFVLPAFARRSDPQTFNFHVMPENEELPGSPLTVSFPSEETEARLGELADEVVELHARLTRIRRRLQDMDRRRAYTLTDYPEWYDEYAPLRRQRTLAARPTRSTTPLVSIVCPVHKPRLEEFRAAVTSIRAQTYDNWELILVDDGCLDARLTAQIDAFTALDRRIKAKPLARHGGISHATNHALDYASGRWITFFDHDDMLADVAIEIMVTAAIEADARLVYSDEDKIDRSGNHFMPAFKPDWNHRLLLGVNYVSHLLMVRRDVLDTAGTLDPRFDGAQDHDLVLRIAERLPTSAILHVPEILYHWRAGEGSTALDLAAKPYAVEAGVACVSAHLARIRRPAEVTSMRAGTFYHQRWMTGWEPAVEIIIPFRDEIEMTSRCVEAVLSLTRYDNHRLTLIDNWSTSVEAEAFVDRMTLTDRVVVRRMEEEFNYSRLNNIVAASSDADFLFLMNNDVVVEDPLWLGNCVAEMLADPSVAVVGGKLLYPGRTVQHGGIVTGLGGVAGHIGVGHVEQDFGYAGRLMFAQEVAAVTAAAMLVRKSAFDAVGGLDEDRLKVAFNDVDLCLKLRMAGYKIIWTPDFVAEHHESLTRGSDERPIQEVRFFDEAQTMIERWNDQLVNDPFYNKNFTLDRSPFSQLRVPKDASDRSRAFKPAGSSAIDPMQPGDQRWTERAAPASSAKQAPKGELAMPGRKARLSRSLISSS